MHESRDPADILDILGDKNARAILKHASQQPMSAKGLREACDASTSTIYRRLDELEALDLLTASSKLDPDGNHHTVYETATDALEIRFSDGVIDVQSNDQEDAVDTFARTWDDLRRFDQ
ncbi:helix-turn-helix domain-containing protein [Halocatena marina]|uniref:Helix-turn-helix domain-containing protein n=1 Tax=Halocatena marina TaxID=2934937 RepID=A0ABD5YY41_9EURY|nr:helix-turn-helix domain-containing protein [Halocatena marina]